MSRNRAFTLIELTIVVALIALFAALIAPSLAAQKAGNERREFYRATLRVIGMAREAAIEQKQPVVLTYDDGSKALAAQVDTETENQLNDLRGTSSTGSSSPTTLKPSTSKTTSSKLTNTKGTDSESTIAQITVPSGMTMNEFRLDKQTVSSAEWKVRFYPDGHSDSAAFSLEDDNVQQSLIIKDNGSPSFSEGPLPDPTDDRWQAGDYEHRQ